MEASIGHRLLKEPERRSRQAERRPQERQFAQDLRAYTGTRESPAHSHPASTVREEVGELKPF